MNAEQWNERYPVGTDVIYYPIAGRKYPYVIAKTRSKAWELGSGHPVVKIEGKPGGVSLRHIEITRK